ncbi:hypothetical protein [Pedobacter nyackensis]|uniref:Uncharacterized protein n=1 Tax=Pedobacter nyackensis TaxID=475255 RepID=A0A1W2EHV8_9SPHI|nr:hypothetical protein [Pedobacter nyackensis]SMD09291.1 hypothetical protein SAMN04488101_112110 [Pedobacter nyackensis]
MYAILLPLHSLVRWLVLITLVFAIIRAYRGWISCKSFSKFDDALCKIVVNVLNIQMTIGIVLYCISPIVSYFLHNFKEAVHQRQVRFFGMEHITMMIIAVIVITIGFNKVKYKTSDEEKYKTMAIWFAIGLFIILSSIPWAFSPLTSRPNFRPF